MPLEGKNFLEVLDCDEHHRIHQALKDCMEKKKSIMLSDNLKSRPLFSSLLWRIPNELPNAAESAIQP